MTGLAAMSEEHQAELLRKALVGVPLLHPQRKNFCLHEAKFRAGAFADRNFWNEWIDHVELSAG